MHARQRHHGADEPGDATDLPTRIARIGGITIERAVDLDSDRRW